MHEVNNATMLFYFRFIYMLLWVCCLALHLFGCLWTHIYRYCYVMNNISGAWGAFKNTLTKAIVFFNFFKYDLEVADTKVMEIIRRDHSMENILSKESMRDCLNDNRLPKNTYSVWRRSRPMQKFRERKVKSLCLAADRKTCWEIEAEKHQIIKTSIYKVYLSHPIFVFKPLKTENAKK